MIGSLIASGIAGYVLGSCNQSDSRREYIHQQPYHNQLIEYHKWLEKKQKDEEYQKHLAEVKKKEFERTHCKICGKKIEYKVDHFKRACTLGDDIRVTVSCGCNIPFVNTKEDICFDYMSYDEQLKVLRELYSKGYDDLKLREKEKLEQKQRKAW